ncbi:MAG: hypothetical protein ABI343_16610, partial [Burkholderiaceae bacterium]
MRAQTGSPSERPAQAAPASTEGAHAAEALALYARVLAATSLEAAAHSLVAALTERHGFSRASLGLHVAGRTRLLASTHLDPAQAQGELQQRLVGAMDEAIEQGVALSWPPAVPGAAAQRTAHGSQFSAFGTP